MPTSNQAGRKFDALFADRKDLAREQQKGTLVPILFGVFVTEKKKPWADEIIRRHALVHRDNRDPEADRLINEARRKRGTSVEGKEGFGMTGMPVFGLDGLRNVRLDGLLPDLKQLGYRASEAYWFMKPKRDQDWAETGRAQKVLRVRFVIERDADGKLMDPDQEEALMKDLLLAGMWQFCHVFDNDWMHAIDLVGGFDPNSKAYTLLRRKGDDYDRDYVDPRPIISRV
jgi:hypothetical protein